MEYTRIKISDEPEPPTLCLNMIVKNESRVIERMLSSVADMVDTYCICDTGSTDNTKELITAFFEARGISGKIVEEPFRDFGYNRSFAMKACEGMPNADYLLLMDADMILERNEKMTPDEIKMLLKDDVYYIFQGSPQFFYKNVRVVKNNKGCTYWGVTHEYCKTPEGSEARSRIRWTEISGFSLKGWRNCRTTTDTPFIWRIVIGTRETTTRLSKHTRSASR
jgi:glycosyltransferase involved in cell wall biosynthesis